MFADQIKILDKGLEALTRTTNSAAQLEELQKAFEKFGITDEAELQNLRTRFALVSDFRKVEASMVQANKNYTDKLNRAGLKEVALLNQKAEQEALRNVLLEDQKLAMKSGEDGLAQELKLLKLANNEEKTRTDIIKNRVSEQARLGGKDMGAAMGGSAYIEQNREVFDAAKTSEKIKMVSTAMQPMMDNIKALGPEGELVSALAQGAFAIGESFESLSEKLGENSATAADKLQAFAALVNATASIVAAASKAKIAGIDDEIAAEKRRDGKSAASAAKITALEKKKEREKKKAFDINKKLQMAQVAVAVAASIAHNITAASAAAAQSGLAAPAVFSGVLGMLNAVTLGLGAAQIAIIAGTSYQGGGSAGASAGGVTGVSMGERKNSVDLAKGGSQAGELAYARGASGVGEMTDFKPAFAGYKNRAAGGFVVGEQGPEVFMPDVPGEIIPSGQSTVAPTNVNFNIQAIDSSGVEEMLSVQRGNIIKMIREAANQQGEMFLESVAETQL